MGLMFVHETKPTPEMRELEKKMEELSSPRLAWVNPKATVHASPGNGFEREDDGGDSKSGIMVVASRQDCNAPTIEGTRPVNLRRPTSL